MVQDQKEERRSENEEGRSIILNMEPRVPWPLSGPKSGLEFPRIALCGLDSLTDIASFFFYITLLSLFWRKSNFCDRDLLRENF